MALKEIIKAQKFQVERKIIFSKIDEAQEEEGATRTPDI